MNDERLFGLIFLYPIGMQSKYQHCSTLPVMPYHRVVFTLRQIIAEKAMKDKEIMKEAPKGEYSLENIAKVTYGMTT